MRRLAMLILLGILVAGCAQPAEPTPPTEPTPVEPTAPTDATPIPPTPTPRPPPEILFDGERALEHVRAQITGEDGGPQYRVPGTPGNDEAAREITATMRALGFTVGWHHFNATYGCEPVAMHNVVAERTGTTGRVVAFAAHYDTRPVADKDPDPANRAKPILGANDGGSGVGVLLELARVLPKTNDTLRFLFFDGEDGGGAWSGCRTDWILGSRAYAESLTTEELANIRALVLVDMVGDPDLLLPKEGYTATDARGAVLQNEVYARAAALGYDQFLDVFGVQILDDHVPFLERKVPALDLIHTIPNDPRVFPGWHHTLDDDIDVVSAESLAAVGRTIESWFHGLS